MADQSLAPRATARVDKNTIVLTALPFFVRATLAAALLAARQHKLNTSSLDAHGTL